MKGENPDKTHVKKSNKSVTLKRAFWAPRLRRLCLLSGTSSHAAEKMCSDAGIGAWASGPKCMTNV